MSLNNYSSRKRILITGGAGFLGSHLTKKLLDAGHEVVCADSLFTGTKDNIAEFKDNPYYEFIRHDITNPLQVEVDEIYNLACPASPIHYQHNPIHTVKTSVMGAINMLELAKHLQCKILHASGKRCAETLFFDFHRQENIDIRIVRIFNTYGPNMHPQDGRVVSNFIMQALRGDPITIYGDGTQSRSFCYVDDLINGFVKFMDLEPGATGPINLGNPNEFTIRELAEAVIKLTNSKSELINNPLPKDDPQQRQPEISYTKKLIDWEPQIQLEEGLKKTITYFEKFL